MKIYPIDYHFWDKYLLFWVSLYSGAIIGYGLGTGHPMMWHMPFLIIGWSILLPFHFGIKLLNERQSRHGVEQ